MKMRILSGGRARVRKTMYEAEAPRGETLDVPVSCIFLRHACRDLAQWESMRKGAEAYE